MLQYQWILPTHFHSQASFVQTSQDACQCRLCWFLLVSICQVLQVFWYPRRRHCISWIRLSWDPTPVIGNERKARSDLEEDKYHLVKHLPQRRPWYCFHTSGNCLTLEWGIQFYFESRVDDKIYFFLFIIFTLFPLFLPFFNLIIFFFMILFDLLCCLSWNCFVILDFTHSLRTLEYFYISLLRLCAIFVIHFLYILYKPYFTFFV